jgi:hypothetical protein
MFGGAPPRRMLNSVVVLRGQITTERLCLFKMQADKKDETQQRTSREGWLPPLISNLLIGEQRG